MERNAVLKTKATRDLEEQRRMRRYRYTLLRIRFPDGIMLQGELIRNDGLFVPPRVTNIFYTLSHLENDRDVSAYSGGRRLSSRAQLVCFLTRSKRNTEIDA